MTIERDTSTSVELDARGVVVVVKRARSTAGVDRIDSESRILDLARHPGVVDLVGTVDSDGKAAVVTRWVGPNTVAGVVSPSLAQVAAIMAALADCVADLHELGVIHGAITADHVIFSPTGQPVLCGFGRSHGLPADRAPAETGPEDDVSALGSLLRTLAGAEVDLEPIPERRAWRRRPRWQGYQRRALFTLADHATRDERDLRPTARALASAIHDSIPDARLGPLVALPEVPLSVLRPSTSETDGSAGASPTSADTAAAEQLGDVRFERQTSRSQVTIGATSPGPDNNPLERHLLTRRTAAAVVGLLGVALLLYGLHELRGSRSTAASRAVPTTANHPPASPPTGALPSTTQARSSTKAATRRTTPPGNCPSTAAGGVDLDADGCPDPVRVSGAEVQAAGVRYAVGRAGDRVVVGDWRCDGHSTPAVLRPTTGEVFVFPRWAASDREVTTASSTRVTGGSVIHAADTDHDGCSELWVRTTDGRSVMIAVGSAP